MPRVREEQPPLAATAVDSTEGSREVRRESGIVVHSATPSARVLVADDDADTRSAIEQILTDDGYEVLQASNGEETLEMLARAADEHAGARGALPDVVLLDFVMPGFSGIGILRVMRRFEHPPTTILMTAFPDRSVDTLARNLGAFRVLRKPIDEDALCDAVLAAVSATVRARAGG